MNERPILFSTPMVRALLDGTKTQTRRVLRRQPEPARAIYGSAGADTTITPNLHRCENGIGVAWRFEMSRIESGNGRHFEASFIDHEPVRIVCPYGQPGDRLWVREAIRLVPDQEPDDGTGRVLSTYDADGSLTVADAWPWKRRYLPPMHCPRGLSRIDLEVTGVRVERLQDVSDADALAEGIASHPDGPWHAYRSLWTLINGAGSWDVNPWVWVVEFRNVTRAAAAIGEGKSHGTS